MNLRNTVVQFHRVTSFFNVHSKKNSGWRSCRMWQMLLRLRRGRLKKPSKPRKRRKLDKRYLLRQKKRSGKPSRRHVMLKMRRRGPFLKRKTR